MNFNNVLKNKSPYLIAEIGVNHEGSIAKAKKMINLAKRAGANCVKFQTYKAEKLASIKSPYYWDIKKEKTRTQFELFKKFDTFNTKQYRILYDYCSKLKIDFLTTPFDIDAVDDIDDFVKFHKISSSDLNNFPLIEKICSKNKTILISTGASTYQEIKKTVNFINKINSKLKIVLLHCVLSYPTKNSDANLNFITLLKRKFPQCIVGYSDHTLPSPNMDNLLFSYILGAQIIEKHFTLDKTKKGNDHYHSMDYIDIKNFIRSIKNYNSIIGEKSKFRNVLECEKVSRINARRNIYTNSNLKKGSIIKSEDIICKRPAIGGLDPIYFKKIIGKKMLRNLKKDVVIKLKDFR